MRPTTVLATITGRDRPGVTAAFFAALAAHDIEIRDVEQVVIRDRLLLAVLVDLRGDPRSLRASVTATASALGMQSDVMIADDAGRPADRAPRGHVTVLGRPLRAGALSTLAQRITDVDGAIESVLQLSAEPAGSVEMLVRAERPRKLRLALHRAAEDAGVDIAMEAAGLLRRPKRLVLIDLDRILLRTDPRAVLCEHAGVADVPAGGPATEVAAALTGLPLSALHAVRDRLRPAPGAAAFVRTLHDLGFAVGVLSDGFGVITDRFVAELHLDFVAANALEIHGDRVSGRLLEPELDGPAKAAALRRFATQRRIPASQTVAVGRAADDPTALLEAGLAISLSRRTCTAADPGSQDTLDSVLFLLGIGADAVQR